MAASLSERILAALHETPGLDDDKLAELLGVSPRQTVNQAARRLAEKGYLVRRPGPEGKITNYLPDDRVLAPPTTQPSSPMPDERITEDEIKRAVAEYLVGRGWEVEVRWGRERGIDIEAYKETERLICEAKGQAPAGPQQVNYFLGALGELVQRMSDPRARYALALPDHRQYRGLVRRLPVLVWERLNLTVFFVSSDSDGNLAVEEVGLRDRAQLAPDEGSGPDRPGSSPGPVSRQSC